MCRLRESGKNPFGLYRVREGDTLASVCAKFSLPQTLVAARCGGGFPPPGALLLLPAAGKTHVVRPGETLASLCKKYGQSEEEFCARNACAYVYPTQTVLLADPQEAR